MICLEERNLREGLEVGSSDMNLRQETKVSGDVACALCLKPRPLCQSHLIPAFIHRLLKKDQQLVVMASDNTFPTSKEICQRLLCADCEIRFGRAEKFCSEVFMQADGQFPLRDVLRGAEVIAEDRRSSVKRGTVLGDEQVHKLTYFALSVFWRGSVTKWKYERRELKKNHLGEKYEELLRRYLLGEGQVPDAMSLMILLSNAPNPMPFLHAPISSRYHGYYTHHFSIPGMQFVLTVGQVRPTGCDELCVWRSVQRPIVISALPDKDIHEDALRIMRTSVVSENLLQSKL